MDWNDLQEIHDAIAVTAFNIYMQHQSITPQIFIMHAGNCRQLVTLPSKVVASMYETEYGKNHLSELIRQIMDPNGKMTKDIESRHGFRPDVLIEVHQTTLYPHDPLTGIKVKESCQDCVMVVLHTVFGSIPVIHQVVKQPYPHVVPSPFPEPEVLSHFRGRFTVQGDVHMHAEDNENIASLDRPYH